MDFPKRARQFIYFYSSKLAIKWRGLKIAKPGNWLQMVICFLRKKILETIRQFLKEYRAMSYFQKLTFFLLLGSFLFSFLSYQSAQNAARLARQAYWAADEASSNAINAADKAEEAASNAEDAKDKADEASSAAEEAASASEDAKNEAEETNSKMFYRH
jgi:methyl-accepting chemotaxis protein